MTNIRNIKKINNLNLKKKQSFFQSSSFFYFQHSNKAFVSMIALLLANIFLVIGMSIFNIALREVILSSGARESIFAFYAADGGMECALYWDIKAGVFSNSTSPVSIDCSGQTAIVTAYTDCGVDCRRNTFNLNYSNDSCVQVELFKYPEPEEETIIKSFGQNTCNPLRKDRVERAWKVSY